MVGKRFFNKWVTVTKIRSAKWLKQTLSYNLISPWKETTEKLFWMMWFVWQLRFKISNAKRIRTKWILFVCKNNDTVKFCSNWKNSFSFDKDALFFLNLQKDKLNAALPAPSLVLEFRKLLRSLFSLLNKTKWPGLHFSFSIISSYPRQMPH